MKIVGLVDIKYLTYGSSYETLTLAQEQDGAAPTAPIERGQTIMVSETRQRVRGTTDDTEDFEEVEITVNGEKKTVRVPKDKLEISREDLDRIKKQVAISVPLGLYMQIERNAPRDAENNALVGNFVAGLVAEHFNYALPEAKRNRAKLSEEEKQRRKEEAMATRQAQIKAAMSKYGNS